MSNTRDFTSLGVVAKNAVPVNQDNDPDRIVGTPYRNTDLTTFQVTEGERFNIPPVSENDNQKLFNQSSFTDVIDKRGIVGWSNLVDYAKPSLVYASDGNFYTCIKPSGPTPPNFIVDPITDNQDAPLYWLIYKNSTALALDLANQTPGSEGSRLVGYTNKTLYQGIYDCINNLVSSKHIKILASANFRIQALSGINNTVFFGTPAVFNVASITGYTVTTDSVPYISHVDISFENDIDANYSILTFAGVETIDFHTVSTDSAAPYTYNKSTSGISLGARYRSPYTTDSVQNSIYNDRLDACFLAYQILT
jgi:hypothetical protein